MRMRRCAEAIDLAIACTSFNPRPGQKYTRTRVESASACQGALIRPESATTGFCHSSVKFCSKTAATSGDAMVKTTFSSRFHESLVQFVDPVSTAASGVPTSRTTYLWCMRSGTPGIGFVLVQPEAHVHAALDGGLKRPQHDRARPCVEPQVVDRDIEGRGGAVEKRVHPLGDRISRLATVGQIVEVKRRSYRCDGGYRASALGSPVSLRGSSTSTGSGLVAIAAASSGSSVRLTRSKSCGDIAPRASTTLCIQSSRPLQYSVPNRTIGKCSIFPVCASV